MTLSHSYNISLSLKKSSNVLIPTVLGGGRIARSVTRIIIDRYKAFQRCFRASLEGFAMSIGSMTNVIKVNIYGNQEVKRLTMR